MKPFDFHLFVCENERDAANPKGCCASKGAREFTAALKELCKTRGSGDRRIRVNKAGCLDMCAFGTVVVVYPEGVWYRGVKAEDAVEIYESHILNGRPVDRLLLRPGAEK